MGNSLFQSLRGFFRYSWGINDLVHINRVSKDYGDRIAIASLPYVVAGWYMLELEAICISPRARLELIAFDSFDNELDEFHVDTYNSLRAKRLVHLKTGCMLRLFQGFSKPEVSVSAFKLIRVSGSFAASRMLKKLVALHPLYRSGGLSRDAQSSSKAEVAKVQLWTDYDALFKIGTHLFSYEAWLKKFSCCSLPAALTRVNESVTIKPRFTVILPTFKPSVSLISQAIQSVLDQRFQCWELIIVDDGSGDADILRLLNAFAENDSRIKFHAHPENRHISVASNEGLAHASGEWIVFLDHDDLLNTTALFHIDRAIAGAVDCALVYSDVDKIDEGGARSEPYFKPDWNPDLFLSQNMFSHLGAYRADLVKAVGGLRAGYEGSQDYDLALRCVERICPNQIVHIPLVLYHWRIHAGSTAHAIEAKPYAIVAGERALNDHLRRTGLDATAEAVGNGYRVRYALPKVPPLVSLILPTRNGLKLLRRCVESISEKTDYPHYEIIVVDNGSDDKATLRYLEALTRRSNIRVMRDDRPFNYSELNNAAVKVARGEIVGLINNDVEVINADWLSEMVSHALRPGVAAVGARLWYSDDTLQHAGIVLGIHGIAGHVHRFLPRGDVGYCGRASLIQSFSAVTAACLVVRKSIYEELGGLNETELQVACNDVDFCLRAREAGYKNIWTPYAELYHHESASRGFDDTPEKQARSAKEVAYMKQRWGDALLNDPAYNPNLTLDSEDFGLAWPPRVPSLDEVLRAMEQADQASTLASPPALQ